VRSFPRILFLDQSGELGGAELCLADIAECAGERSAVLPFQDGPFAQLLRARNIAVHLATLPKMSARVDKAASLFAYLRAMPGIAMLIFRGLRIAKDFDLLYANTAKALVVGAVLAVVLRKKVLLSSPRHSFCRSFQRAQSFRWLSGRRRSWQIHWRRQKLFKAMEGRKISSE
jgi:hypothetical protein